MATSESSGFKLKEPSSHDTPPPSSTAASLTNGNIPHLPIATTAPTPNGKRRDIPDAGLRSHDHYKRALPPWRFSLRAFMLPLVRGETPYLAYMQSLIRTPLLDTFFAVTANLGTHTFFMISLPIMFWCGFPWLGKGLVHILATGVFFTGILKDLLSLPRPLSPPLHRITMSGSAALEYGFPSTHSANSVSVVAYILFLLRSSTNPLGDNTKLLIEIVAYAYATSIVFGRLYCGMHGFLDVGIGAIMGLALGVMEYYYGPPLDQYLVTSSWRVPLALAIIIIVLVRIHPEPADDCPCFDDSVAFAGVMMGVEFGTWRFSRSAWDYIVLPSILSDDAGNSDPFATAAALGWPKMAARVVVGVLVVFLWREMMKPTLLKMLPPLFRLLETQWAGLGMHMPRRFFTTATNYKYIPSSLRMDTVIPDMSDIPDMISSSFKHPGRGRSVSVGPQSAADAYETLAYRGQRSRRQESAGDGVVAINRHSQGSAEEQQDKETPKKSEAGATSDISKSKVSGDSGGGGGGGSLPDGLGEHHQSPLEMYEQMMGQGRVVISDVGNAADEPEIYISRENELGEQEVFSRLTRPRVRYDVEVVTKLVVYAGIGWLSADLIPVLFEFIGLGVSHYK